METGARGRQRIASPESRTRGTAPLTPKSPCPHCGKPLNLFRARSVMTLFARRLYLRCQGWPRCDFYVRYKPRAANDR